MLRYDDKRAGICQICSGMKIVETDINAMDSAQK